MKRILLGALIIIMCLGFTGCPGKEPKISDPCAKVPKVWWGQREVEPTANNAVWECYDWVLISVTDE